MWSRKAPNLPEELPVDPLLCGAGPIYKYDGPKLAVCGADG